MEPLRSLLFVPGNRERMLRKALTLRADALVPDLESSVPMSEKDKAREMVKSALPKLAGTGARIYVRINPFESGLTWDDLNAVISQHIHGVSIAKVDSADQVRELDEIITTLERGKHLPFGQVRIIPWIENARGIIRAFEIASASSRVIAIAFGAEDFAADMGVARSRDGMEILYARNHVAISARAAHKIALDTGYVHFNDLDGLRADASLALRLGFKGKFAIHPSQVKVINEVFSPTQAEIDQAKKVVKLFQNAETRGEGTTSLEGQMIDVDIALRAQKLLLQAESLAEKESPRN